MNSTKLFRRWAKAVGGPKIASKTLRRHIATIYRMARHPMTVDDPDGSGSLNHFDDHESMIAALAARKTAESRVTLREIQLHTERHVRAALEASAEPVSREGLIDAALKALRETTDVLEHCAKEDFKDKDDFDRLTLECLEARERLDQILMAAEAGQLVCTKTERFPQRPRLDARPVA